MIDFYTWSTPNGLKVRIMLEETDLEYELHTVNLGEGEQKKPEYLAINPNGKIPAIIDRDGPGCDPLTIFESGAILLYLVVLPLLYARMHFIRALADRLVVPVPGMRHAFFAVLGSVIIGLLDVPRKWEVYELVFALLATSIFLLPQNPDKTRSP